MLALFDLRMLGGSLLVGSVQLCGLVVPASTHARELVVMLGGVVGAEQQFATTRHGGSDICLSAAAIAAVGCGELERRFVLSHFRRCSRHDHSLARAKKLDMHIQP